MGLILYFLQAQPLTFYYTYVILYIRTCAHLAHHYTIGTCLDDMYRTK